MKTRNEIATGGKNGVGQGVASLFSNVIGGSFEWGKFRFDLLGPLMCVDNDSSLLQEERLLGD